MLEIASVFDDVAFEIVDLNDWPLPFDDEPHWRPQYLQVDEGRENRPVQA